MLQATDIYNLEIDSADLEKLARRIAILPNTQENRKQIENISCLPLKAMAAVYSIGLKTKTWENIITRFCNKVNWEYRIPNGFIGRGGKSTGDLINLLENYPSYGAGTILSKHRTSAVNGILKSEALHEFCIALHKNGVQFDINECKDGIKLFDDIKKIRGQKSGISYIFFLMLCGNESLVKPDRQILRYVKRELPNRAWSPFEAAGAVYLSAPLAGISPREADRRIWGTMSRYDTLGDCRT